MMVSFRLLDGTTASVQASRIVSVVEAGASSQWHGVRALVKVDGEKWPMESTEEWQTISERVAAAMAEGAR